MGTKFGLIPEQDNMLKELNYRLLSWPQLVFEGVRWYWEKPIYTSDRYPNPETHALFEQVLKELQAEYEEFPYCRCEDAGLKIQELGKGLKMVVGRFETDFDRLFGKTGQTHWWCVDLNWTIVDLTASQFNGMMWGKNRISEGVYVLTRDHPLYRRFIPGDL